LPERTEWAILRAMAVEKDQRPPTCREFVEDLTGHSTRRLPTTDSSTPIAELWYLVYRDDEGATHTVKGSTSAIRRSLREGLLGDAGNVRAARSKAGPFEALRGFPEFRDLVVAVPAGPAALPARPSTPRARRAAPAPAPTVSAGPVPHINLGGRPSDESPEW